MKNINELLNSSDYKERFKGEYLQLNDRTVKLESMIDKWELGKLGFEPTCPRKLLISQLNTMKYYLIILKERARIENIDLKL